MTNYHSIWCTDTDFNKMWTKYYRGTYCFYSTPATACIWHSSYLENLHFTAGFPSQ